MNHNLALSQCSTSKIERPSCCLVQTSHIPNLESWKLFISYFNPFILNIVSNGGGRYKF